MDRALRILAIIALVSLGLFVALARLLDAVQQPAMGYGFPSATDLLLPAIPSILVNLLGSAGSALCLAVGVVAVVASIQRQQRGWAIGFLALLCVAVIGSELVTEIVGQLTPVLNAELANAFVYSPYVRLLLTALVPLVVLAYNIYFHPRATQPTQSTAIVE